MLTLDHLKLIDADVRELKRFRNCVLGAMVGQLTECGVLHEADDSCCRREPWADTMYRLLTAIAPPRPIVAVNLDHPPSEGVGNRE
jgi:hypothetical protein